MVVDALLNQDQFTLLAIVIALTAYTAFVRQSLRKAMRGAEHGLSSTSPVTRLANKWKLRRYTEDYQLMLAADVMLVSTLALLIVRIFMWANGKAGGLLFGWIDFDRLIMSLAGVAILYLAWLHIRGWKIKQE